MQFATLSISVKRALNRVGFGVCLVVLLIMFLEEAELDEGGAYKSEHALLSCGLYSRT